MLIATSAVFDASVEVAFLFAGRGHRFTFIMVVIIMVVIIMTFFGFLGY